VKIDKFEDDDFTIHFQKVEDGNIIQVLDKVLCTLDYKFLIRNISFEGMNSIETLEYPVPALREMLLRIIHFLVVCVVFLLSSNNPRKVIIALIINIS
jgi:ATP-dependent DNA helicase RecG